jgi:uncharacterized membrane protein YkoI
MHPSMSDPKALEVRRDSTMEGESPMKPNKTIITLSIACLAVGTSLAATTTKKTMHPKITESVARAIAQAKVPHGKVKSHELERESGHLIYSYDFVVPGKSGIDEVNIDAMTGKVIAVEHEGHKAEKKELAKEKKEASAPSSAH